MRGEVVALQERIRGAMGAGVDLEQVNEEIIEPTRMTEDAKAALWLYGWSCKDRSQQIADSTRMALNAF
jgi:hypothetical protein